MKGEKKDFQPYVDRNKKMTELTGSSIAMGIFIAILFGVANAYLGLRVGMTVSAAIPAAVLSMGAMRMKKKKDTILESNMIQTIGAAGEALSAGVIFTLPAIFLWAGEGRMEKPGLLEIMLIALIGGLLGVLFMIPLRKPLVVEEHETLPYPEAKACAEVLMAGEKDRSGTSKMFAGMGFAAVYKFVVDGLKLIPGEIAIRFQGFAGEIGTQIYPAVMSVGYLCGAKISSFMFAGGVLGWLVIIPMIVLFGADTVLYPGTVPIRQAFAEGGASEIWSLYIRYIGAGALAAGGVISLAKSLPLIVRTFIGVIKGFKNKTAEGTARTEQDIPMKGILAGIVILAVAALIAPMLPISWVGTVLILLFGFFFATVAARIVGLVGSSNSPVSGMTIATLLFATVILLLIGNNGAKGMESAIVIGAVVCICAAISGDTSQALKTGYLLGATPKRQQIGKIIGVVVSAIAIGVTLYLLDAAWGFGTEELAAPQAALMKMIVEGVMEGSLPWGLVMIGVFITVVAEILGIPSLPFAIGLYLPVHLSSCVMFGGLVRLFLEKRKCSEEEKQDALNEGMLFSSGMIAGEGIMGVGLAVLAVFGLDQVIDLSGVVSLPGSVSSILSAVIFALAIFLLIRSALGTKKK